MEIGWYKRESKMVIWMLPKISAKGSHLHPAGAKNLHLGIYNRASSFGSAKPTAEGQQEVAARVDGAV